MSARVLGRRLLLIKQQQPTPRGVATSHRTTFGSSRYSVARRQQQRPYTSYSSYEYPLAKEPPEVTRTTADEAQKSSRSNTKSSAAPDRISSSSATSADGISSQEHPDPFDDQHTLSDDEVQAIRQAQKQHINTQLSTGSATAITSTVPTTVPPNVPADQLAVPETLITRLDNGVRVVSQETYGQVSAVGVVCELGSRQENPRRNLGVTNLLEVLAFGATRQYTASKVTTLLQDWGGQRFVTTGREQSLHCIDLLRPNVENAMNLLQQVLLEPQFLPDEVEDAKRALEFQALDLPPELLLGEALQEAAYGKDQQLGQPHFYLPHNVQAVESGDDAAAAADLPPPELTAETVHDYWQRQFVQNPSGLVVGGAGVRHDFLVEQAQRHFGHLQQDDTQRTLVQPSVYRGGERRLTKPTVDGLVRIAVGLEVGGWHSDDLVATCVLQTLLGGGSSFSAGGPGKGMYSRLYRQVLNQYGWAESAQAYSSFHAESGLWGITGSALPHNARDMVQVFCQHLARLAVEPVSDEELDRARNMLKCNVLSQLESRLVLFEDMGRQVLTYGQRECMNVTCEKITAVTAEDILQVAKTALQQPPTVACVGDNVSSVPRHDEVVKWLV